MKIFTGTVTSNKSQYTVGVTVEYQRPHPKYGKLMRQKTKLLAHNLLENIAEGDTVIIETCKPISKNKFFRVREIIGKGKTKGVVRADSKVKNLEEVEEKKANIGEKVKSQKEKVKSTSKNTKVTKK